MFMIVIILKKLILAHWEKLRLICILKLNYNKSCNVRVTKKKSILYVGKCFLPNKNPNHNVKQ